LKALVLFQVAMTRILLIGLGLCALLCVVSATSLLTVLRDQNRNDYLTSFDTTTTWILKRLNITSMNSQDYFIDGVVNPTSPFLLNFLGPPQGKFGIYHVTQFDRSKFRPTGASYTLSNAHGDLSSNLATYAGNTYSLFGNGVLGKIDFVSGRVSKLILIKSQPGWDFPYHPTIAINQLTGDLWVHQVSDNDLSKNVELISINVNTLKYGATIPSNCGYPRSGAAAIKGMFVAPTGDIVLISGTSFFSIDMTSQKCTQQLNLTCAGVSDMSSLSFGSASYESVSKAIYTYGGSFSENKGCIAHVTVARRPYVAVSSKTINENLHSFGAIALP
jgi:hypothetical protein